MGGEELEAVAAEVGDGFELVPRHERQQLVQGVEPGHLVGGQMLDAATPRRRTMGPRAKLDHKGLIARECRLG